MLWVILASGLVVAIALLALGARLSKGLVVSRTSDDVLSAIDEVLDDARSHDNWDEFICSTIADPRLESIRQRCIGIVQRHQAKERGADIAAAGKAELRVLRAELSAGQ